MTLPSWLRVSVAQDGDRSGVSCAEQAETRELRRRVKQLDQEENEVPRRGLSVAGEPAG